MNKATDKVIDANNEVKQVLEELDMLENELGNFDKTNKEFVRRKKELEDKLLDKE